jgi:two-component system, LytTR family, response regulator LytT
MHILLIDDDPIWLIKIEVMLDEIGIKTIRKCSDLMDIENEIEDYSPDLIITDVILNDEVIFKIKPLLISKNIPCIFVSAAPIQSNYNQAKTIPNSRFLIKPFHTLTLQDAIESLSLIPPKTIDEEKGIHVYGKFRQKILIKLEDILWLDAERNYTTICTINQKKHTIKKALVQVATDLDTRFLQVHRSIIVNTDYIIRIDFAQDKINVNGNFLRIGRSFKNDIATFANKKA